MDQPADIFVMLMDDCRVVRRMVATHVTAFRQFRDLRIVRTHVGSADMLQAFSGAAIDCGSLGSIVPTSTLSLASWFRKPGTTRMDRGAIAIGRMNGDSGGHGAFVRVDRVYVLPR
jgi:hypothetical protein